mmetsp:Transcript_37288/g.73174  ORF Transcript_37288/g.73174 Transcript_37288/m.73174 type:complete len:231 (-) Transcript_37288:135-827(-)
MGPIHPVREPDRRVGRPVLAPDPPPFLEDRRTVPAQDQFDRQPQTHGSAAHHQTAQGDDVRVRIGKRAQVARVVRMAPARAPAGQAVQLLPQLGPLPFAAVADQRPQLLVRHHRVHDAVGSVGAARECVVVIDVGRRGTRGRVDHDALHEGIEAVTLFPGGDDVFALAPRFHLFREGVFHIGHVNGFHAEDMLQQRRLFFCELVEPGRRGVHGGRRSICVGGRKRRHNAR